MADSESKICVAIITCEAHRARYDKFMSIFKDQFEENGIDYYAIRADPDLNIDPEEGDKLYKLDGRDFWTKTEEVYEKLHQKLMIFYSYIETETDYTNVIKVDDGCLLDLSVALSDLHLDYIGHATVARMNRYHRGKCKEPKWNTYVSDFKHDLQEVVGEDEFKRLNLTKTPYAAGGCAYRLSRKALTGISRFLPHSLQLEFAYEDLLIGQILKINGISVSRKIIGRHHRIKV
jgi:hypothetical protein